MMNPAERVIEICGGVTAVAHMVGRSEMPVRRWTYPKERGGTGGLIPSAMQTVLLERARAQGIDLRPEHFFPEHLVAPSASVDDDDESERGAA